MRDHRETARQLALLVPPPAVPQRAGTEAGWALADERLGFRVPEDLRRLVLTYGDGSWNEYLWLLSPFSHNTYRNLMRVLGEYRLARETPAIDTPGCHDLVQRMIVAPDRLRRASCPWPMFPDAGGLIPWGTLVDDVRVYYLPDPAGEIDRIVVESWTPGQYHYDQIYETSASGFLHGWLTGQLQPRGFPLPTPPVFKPVRVFPGTEAEEPILPM